MRIYLILAFVCSWLMPSVAWAQQDNDNIVEVSGVVVTRNSSNNQRFDKVPYATVAVLGTSRGTYANYDGMFSIVVKKGQTVQFSAVGFATQAITIPENLEGLHHSIVIELVQQPINMNEVMVLPWPNRNNLTAEFLAMEPNAALQMEELARRNLEERQLLAMQQLLAMDSKDAATYYLHKQARTYSTMGQVQAQPIFDVMAWSRFLKEQQNKKKAKEKAEKETGKEYKY